MNSDKTDNIYYAIEIKFIIIIRSYGKCGVLTNKMNFL